MKPRCYGRLDVNKVNIEQWGELDENGNEVQRRQVNIDDKQLKHVTEITLKIEPDTPTLVTVSFYADIEMLSPTLVEMFSRAGA